MMKVSKHRLSLAILSAALLSSLLPVSCPAAAERSTIGTMTVTVNAADVLILNSYHPGYPWSDGEQAGVLETLERADGASEPSIEYLDCKRLPEAERGEWLVRYLRAKYSARRFKLLILMDNPALNVGLAIRDEVFPDAAVVFCGVNGYRTDLLDGRPRVTGVAEMLNAATTVDVALRLHPKTREVVVVSDYTVTGLVTRRELEEALPQFGGRATFRFVDDLPIEEIANQLAALPADRLVVILSYAADGNGQVFSHEISTRRLCGSCPVPVYAVHELRLGYGIVGGNLLDGRLHGNRAGEMAIRILRGEDAARIPVELKATSRLMFDYRQLARFGIARSALPAGAVVINEPESVFRGRRPLIVSVVMTLTLLSLTVFVLTASILRRRRAESRLRALSLRQEAILASVPDIIAHTDVHKIYTWLNRSGREFFGEDAIGREASFYFEGEQETYHAVQPLFDGREDVIYVESWQRRRDGERRLLAWWCRVTKDEHGRVTGALSTGRDITSLKIAQEELRRRGEELAKANEALRLAVRAGNVGLWDWDLRTNQVNYSREWKRQIGYEEHEISNEFREWEQRVHPDDLEETLATVSAYRADPGPGYEAEFRFQHKNGSYRWILTQASAVCDENGEPTRMLGSHVDMTERKQAETEREQLLQELAEKNHELEGLLYAASHDLRAPLVNIHGFSRELEEACREQDAMAREEQVSLATRFIRISVQKMEALINGMLKVSRTGRVPIRADQLDVERILEEVTASLSYQIQSASAEVTIEPLPGCCGDGDQINQAFTNLLDNALKYRDPGRPLRITVSGRTKGREAVYCVEDTGSGIPAEEQERVWEIFHRINPRGEVEGEGVGLTLVRRIAERHHGRVRMESQPGSGSRFYLALPRGEQNRPGGPPTGQAEGRPAESQTDSGQESRD